MPCDGRYEPDFKRLAKDAAAQIDFNAAPPEGDESPKIDSFIYRPVEHKSRPKSAPSPQAGKRNPSVLPRIPAPRRNRTPNQDLSKWGFRALPKPVKRLFVMKRGAVCC